MSLVSGNAGGEDRSPGAEGLPALPPDEQVRLLLAVARNEDRQAFARLFQYFAPRLKSYLMRPGMTPGAAEEIAQETMLTVWRKASYFDPARAGAATWVFTIARNLRIDHQRRYHRPDDGAIDPSDEPDQPPSGEAILLTAEREAKVREALKTLSEDQATIVRLSFFDETPHAEIARVLDIPLGTVKSRVRLAMGRLRAFLDGHYDPH